MTTVLNEAEIAEATEITNQRGAAHSPNYTYVNAEPSNSDQTCNLVVRLDGGGFETGKSKAGGQDSVNWLRDHPNVGDAYRTAIHQACDNVEKRLGHGA